MYMFVCGYASMQAGVYICAVCPVQKSVVFYCSQTHVLRQGLSMNLGAYLARVPGK